MMMQGERYDIREKKMINDPDFQSFQALFARENYILIFVGWKLCSENLQ